MHAGEACEDEVAWDDEDGVAGLPCCKQAGHGASCAAQDGEHGYIPSGVN